MQLGFVKMHGLGNDFVILDATRHSFSPDSSTIARLARRRTGIGCDQVLLLESAERPDAAVFYRTFNADGLEVEQCGNGVRCIASLIDERLRAAGESAEEIVLDSVAGAIRARMLDDDQVSVNMGVPDFTPASLPFEATTEAYVYTLEVAGTEVEIGAVSIGNPHAVLTVPSVDTAPVDRLGPAIEIHPRFGNRTNVEFMEVRDDGHIRLRVHERGTGETRACGTGACGAVAVGRRHGVLKETVTVDLPGGRLTVTWPGDGHDIWLTGPVEKSFEGTIEL